MAGPDRGADRDPHRRPDLVDGQGRLDDPGREPPPARVRDHHGGLPQRGVHEGDAVGRGHRERDARRGGRQRIGRGERLLSCVEARAGALGADPRDRRAVHEAGDRERRDVQPRDHDAPVRPDRARVVSDG